MPGVGTAISDEERRKKSVYYEACTSPYKDDFPTLVKCLRFPEPGNPHTRQEAGFLLWHHTLEGDNLGGLISAGLLTACVANLDSPELLPADKACSAGILLALACDHEDTAEQLMRCRVPSGSTSLEVLHAVLRDDAALARQYCSRVLQALAQQVAPTVLRAMDNQLPYLGIYMELWAVKDHRDPTTVAALVHVVDLLLEQRPELSSSVVEAGCLEALLDVIRNHKSEVTISRALNCLSKLLTHEGAMERLIKSGGIPLLVDVMGPPPRVALENRPESIEVEISVASAPETPQPPLLSPMSMSVSARHASDTDEANYTIGGELDDEAASAVIDVSGGDVNGRNDSNGSSGGGDSADVTGLAAAAPRDLESDPNGSRRTNSDERFGTQSTRGVMKSAGSPVGSPKGRGAGPAGGGGGGGGGNEWASARTSNRSLGSHGSSSMQIKVQLPLVIPGIPVPSPAAAAAALLGAPSVQSQLSSRTSRNTMLHSADFSAALEGAVEAAAPSGDGSGPGDGGGTAAGVRGSSSPPPLPTATDLATNRCGLRWILLPGLEVAARAATCLTVFMHRPECQVAVELRLVSHRIAAHVKTVMGPKMGATEGGGGSSKKGKKKGLGLTSEQTMGLGRLLGMMKFLLLHNTTRYRIAKLGAVPMLIRLYNEANDYLLRNHCQAILAHVALLAENGPLLQEAKMPEEFLVANPMRLSSYERAVLRIEFPDDPALERR